MRGRALERVPGKTWQPSPAEGSGPVRSAAFTSRAGFDSLGCRFFPLNRAGALGSAGAGSRIQPGGRSLTPNLAGERESTGAGERGSTAVGSRIQPDGRSLPLDLTAGRGSRIRPGGHSLPLKLTAGRGLAGVGRGPSPVAVPFRRTSRLGAGWRGWAVDAARRPLLSTEPRWRTRAGRSRVAGPAAVHPGRTSRGDRSDVSCRAVRCDRIERRGQLARPWAR